MKKHINSLLFLTLLIACSPEERPSYATYENNIPDGGIKINYDPETSLTNISEIQQQLNKNDEQVFISSLTWYGTESEFGFDYIHDKTAKELVDIVNCLKTTQPNLQQSCFTTAKADIR